jgi:hypothetical protein
MAHILDSVKEYLDPEFITEAALVLRDGEAPTARALNAWSAAILAGLLKHVENPKAMNRIYSGLDHFPPNLTAHPGALLRTGHQSQNDPKSISGHLLGQLFGPRITALHAVIAQVSGAHPATVSETLGIAGPMVLSALGARLQAGELSVSGLANMLRAEQPRVAAMLPAEIAEVLDAHTLEAPGSDQPEPAVGIPWGLALLLLMSIGVAVLLWMRQ